MLSQLFLFICHLRQHFYSSHVRDGIQTFEQVPPLALLAASSSDHVFLSRLGLKHHMQVYQQGKQRRTDNFTTSLKLKTLISTLKMLAFEISHAHLNKRQRCGEKDICRTVFQRCRKEWHYIHETFYAQNFRAFIYLQNFLGTVFAACRLFSFHFMQEIHLFYFFCGLQNFCSDSTVTSNCKSASP